MVHAAAPVRGTRSRRAQAGHHLAGRDLVRVGLRGGVAVDDEVPPLRAAGASRGWRSSSAASSTICRAPRRPRGRRRSALVGLPLLVLVTVDLVERARTPRSTSCGCSRTTTCTARRGGPGRDELDFAAPLIVFAVAFALATRALGWRARARWAALGLCRRGDAVHLLPAGRLHARRWRRTGRRRARSPTYYGTRRSPDERLMRLQMYWRGETFYTENEIYEGPHGGADGLRSGRRRREAQGLDGQAPRPARLLPLRARQLAAHGQHGSAGDQEHPQDHGRQQHEVRAGSGRPLVRLSRCAPWCNVGRG